MKKTLPTARAVMAANSTQSMRLIISMYRLIGIGRLRGARVLYALSKHLGENLAGNGRCRMAFVCCVFNQHGYGDLWLVVGCEPDKPRASQPLRLAIDDLVVLRRAGLACHAQSLHCGGTRRAALNSAKHCLPYEFDLLGSRAQMGANIRFAVMDDLAIGGLDALHHIRSQTGAAIGERRRHARHLHGRDQQEALPDRQLDRIAIPPFFAALHPFPGRAWHQTPALTSKVKSRRLTQA